MQSGRSNRMGDHTGGSGSAESKQGDHISLGTGRLAGYNLFRPFSLQYGLHPGFHRQSHKIAGNSVETRRPH